MGEVKDIPKGWERVSLGNLVNKKSVKAVMSEYPDAKFIGMDCIQPNALQPFRFYLFREFKTSGNYFKKNEVLYGRMRPYLNKVYKASFDGVCSGEFIVLACEKALSPDLLQYVLHHRDFVQFANSKTSGDRPRVSFDEISNYEILLPPLPEQHRIVARIEELFSDLDKGIESLKTAQQQLKVYRQAVLKWAFEGRLTNTEFSIVPFGSIIKIVSGNTPKGLESITNKGKIQFYKVSDMNLEGNEVEMKTTKYYLTEEEVKKLKIKLYPKGTVIFPKRGGAILTNKKRILSQSASFDLNLMGALPNERVDGKYLFYWFQRLDLSKIYDGSSVPQINNKNIDPLQFECCDIETQHRIVSEIEDRLSVCDKMEESISQSLQQAEALRQSILKKAFEGKLVPQDPNDEPAGVLLERIRTEKAGFHSGKKGRKGKGKA